MDVLIFFCLGIISSILIDQIKSKTIKVSFWVLNTVLFVFVALSSSDPIVSVIVSKIIGSDSYQIINGAMHTKTAMSLVSYSAYGFLYCFMIAELFYTFVATLIETTKLIKVEIVSMIKKSYRRPRLKVVFTAVKKYCAEIYQTQVNASYSMRC